MIDALGRVPTGTWVVAGAAGLVAFLAGLGALSAQLGGAAVWKGTWRVAFWGAFAMAVTAGAGALFGAVAADVTNAGLASLTGAGIAAARLLLIHLLDPGAIGFGDVKFAAASGLVVAAIAWPAAILVPLVGFVGVAIARIAGGDRPASASSSSSRCSK